MAGAVANTDQFESYFKRADLDQDGRVSGPEAVSFFQASGLPKPVLAQIWSYADQNRTGYLGRAEFYNYLKLVTVAQSKRDLTPDLVKAALYGPASAKIPAPQINLGALPTTPNSNPPPPQMATTPIRAPQGYPPQQIRPPAQPPLPATSFQPSGPSFTTTPRPQGPTNLSQNSTPKPNGVNLSPAVSGGNGFMSNSAFGDSFSAPQVKSNSVAANVSSTSGFPVLPPTSGGAQVAQLPNKPSQPVTMGNQNHQMQPTFRPNQQIPVQGFGPNQNSTQPWPKMSPLSVQKYTKVFMEVDTDRDGKISGDQARNLFLSWKLPREILKQVWDLSDQDDDSMLSLKEFCIALYLMERFREGRALPKVLPPTIFEGSTLPPSGQPQQPPAPLWRPPPGVQQPHGMPGPRQVTARPPRPGPIHDADEDIQPRPRKPTVPTLEKHLVDQLSKEEQNSLNSKFQEATEADKKVVELEKEILEAKQKIEFYRNKMQEIVLYKSRCDSRLNEITERVSTDKREVESLSKKYEDKYKQAGDVASKLTIEEATFRDIQEKKMELYRAIVKLDQDGKPEEIQARADVIQADLEEQVKALNERCKMYGLRGKPTSLVELPFGWQPGFQEGAADWDENWDKFEDEGFTFVKELTLDVENVIAPPKPKSIPVQNKSSFLDNGVSSNHKTVSQDKTPDNESKDTTSSKTPPDSPVTKNPPESPPQIFHDNTTTEDTTSPHALKTHSDNFDTQSVMSTERGGFDDPGWGGTFDSHYDSDTSAWDPNPPKPKDTDHDNSLFDSDSWGGGGLNPIRTELPKKSTFVFDSVPGTPAYSSYAGSPPADNNLFQNRAPFSSSFPDSVPGTPAYSYSGSPRANSNSQQPFPSLFSDSVPSTPIYTNSPRRYSDDNNSFTNNFSRFDSFTSNTTQDSALFPTRDNFSRFDSFRSTAQESEYDSGFGNQQTLARFDSMRSTADSDFGHSLFQTREPEPYARFDSMRSGSEVSGFDDGDLFGSGDPFRSHDPFKSESTATGTRRDSVDGWKAF